jgi:Phycobilisome Linker polypeptide/CpcD/allophycocyanin linker domain
MSTLTAAFTSDIVELRSNSTESDLQVVIRAAYRQVLGNAHLMESQQLISAESALRNGEITVRGFVRQIAQSDLYQSMFFNSNSPYRFIELNCKHLLGRAPLEQTEISQHVQTYNEQGYIAEIDSYLDSDDYIQNFGENVVPYPRSTSSQTGIKNVGYNRMLSLLGGAATSDTSNKAQLITTVAGNSTQKIRVAGINFGSNSGSTSKRFRIVTTKSSGKNVRTSNMTYEVSYAQMSAKIQTIQKMNGKIVSITEVG